MSREHKYIKREGTPGNYKYIYDVKNAFSGFGKGVAKTANTFSKNVASGTTQVFNNLRKDVKNAGSKLVMGANGAVEKVKDSAQKSREAVGDGLVEALEPAAIAMDKFVTNAKKATLKMIDDNKTVTKSGDEYARLYRDKRIKNFSDIESVKGKKKDMQKFDKAYQSDFAAVRATANKEDAYDAMQKAAVRYNGLASDYSVKEAGTSVYDNWDNVKVDELRKKYPHLAKKQPDEETYFIFNQDKYPITYPKALEKDFYEMLDSAEEYAKRRQHWRKTQDHEELAAKVRDKAYVDYENSGARKRLQMRAKAE